MSEPVPLRVHVGERVGEVSALWQRPRGAHAVFAFAHGAGADMHHAFMGAASHALVQRGIAILRFQFPYTEQGKRAPSPRPVLLATVRAAVAEASRRAKGLPVFAGGKSMGGRMTSLALADAGPGEALREQVRGVIFVGFPLHPAGKPAAAEERAAHLGRVRLPMLFLQGTRDKLAELALLRPVCARLGRLATLHESEGADHSFHVLKRSGRSDDEVLAEIAEATAHWIATSP